MKTLTTKKDQEGTYKSFWKMTLKNKLIGVQEKKILTHTVVFLCVCVNDIAMDFLKPCGGPGQRRGKDTF